MTANKDSPGFDICQVTQKSPSEIAKICEWMPWAKGFNSFGWIKYHISDGLTDQEGCTLYKIEKPFRQLSGILPRIWCINLLRRQDRREYMKSIAGDLDIQFLDAVDGQELSMTPEIAHMFRNNDFNNRRAIIGCALSHVTLWKKLASSDQPCFLIMEDDVEWADNFPDKVRHAVGQVCQYSNDWDILYLGFTIYNNIRQPIRGELWNDKFPDVTPFDRHFDGTGFFGYVLSKQGAVKLLLHIERHGINRAIDSLPLNVANFNRWSCVPHIIQTPYVGPFSAYSDTDIQRDMSTL